jgi:uncharacterized membrane protein
MTVMAAGFESPVRGVELCGVVAYSSNAPVFEENQPDKRLGERQMNPLTSVPGAIISGVILAIIAFVIVPGSGFNELSLARWIHILSGVMWIGLLYYFNVAQTPALAAAAADKGGPGGAGINKYVAPRALLWFRWAAVATWLTGAWYLGRAGNFVGALTLGLGGETVNYYQLVIGIGAWLGTIMLFNVWVLIWPNQKKILGLTPATDEQKAAARKTALYASRTNFILSVPMLLCMGSASHGLPF